MFFTKRGGSSEVFTVFGRKFLKAKVAMTREG